MDERIPRGLGWMAKTDRLKFSRKKTKKEIEEGAQAGELVFFYSAITRWLAFIANPTARSWNAFTMGNGIRNYLSSFLIDGRVLKVTLSTILLGLSHL